MTRSANVMLSLIAAAIGALFAGPGQAAPVVWVPAANGNWDIAANWNPGLPGANDDVTIDVAGARVVTVRSTGGPFVINSLIVNGDDALTITAGSLTINGLPSGDNATGASVLAQLTQSGGGILGGTGLVTVTGAASLGSGTHTGAGTTVLRGATSLSGFNLDAGRVLRNEGTATLTGGMNLNITNAAGTGRIENAAGAVFDVRTFNLSLNASNFAGDTGTTAVIDNAGTFRKSTNGTYGVGVTFNNLATGTIDLVLGGLSFTAGGSYSGAVTLATGTTLTWGGGTHTVNSGTTFTGDGTLAASVGTVRLNAATTMNSRFTHSSGTLQGADLTLNSVAQLTGAIHTGTGTTTTKGTSTWSGFSLDAGRVLRNEGTATVTGGLNVNATSTPGSGRIENAQGAVIDVRTFNLSMFASNFAGDTGSDANIGNAGIFRKSTNGGYTVSVPFANLATGTIDVQAGSFNFTGGGSYNGAVTLAGIGTLGFGAGTHAVGAGARFQGPGTLVLSGAGTVLDLVAPTTVDSAFTMNGGTIQGANLTLTGPTNIAIASSLGVMSGNAITTLTGISSVGGGANNPFGLDAGRVLRNEGTMTITGVLNLNRLDTPGAGRIENAVGRLINVNTFNQSIAATAFASDTGADALVSNAGTFRKSGSGGYGVAVPFHNLATGTIDVQQGSFNFTGGGTYNGAVTLANNAGLTLSQGTHNVGTGATFTGPGTLTLAGAGTILNLLAPTTIATRFDMTGGTIGGADLLLNGPYGLTISSSLGVLAGPTTTTLQGNGTVSGGPNNTFGLDAKHVLRNQGSMTITGVLDLNRLSNTGSGRIDNAAGALIDVQTFNQSIFATNWTATNALDGGADARVNNAGTFRMSGNGTYHVAVPFFNTGIVEVVKGALNIPTFANGGTVHVAPGTTFRAGSSFVNTGLIQGGGTVVGPTAGLTNAGTIAPGNSPGHLTIAGDLIMQSDGSVSIELGGVADFDLLTINGDATLAGDLDIVRFAGYAPTVGDSFIVMTFNDRNATKFDRVNLLGFGSGVVFDVTYRDQDVLLGVSAVPEPETWLMLLGGLGLLGLVARHRRERQPLSA